MGRSKQYQYTFEHTDAARQGIPTVLISPGATYCEGPELEDSLKSTLEELFKISPKDKQPIKLRIAVCGGLNAFNLLHKPELRYQSGGKKESKNFKLSFSHPEPDMANARGVEQTEKWVTNNANTIRSAISGAITTEGLKAVVGPNRTVRAMFEEKDLYTDGRPVGNLFVDIEIVDISELRNKAAFSDSSVPDALSTVDYLTDLARTVAYYSLGKNLVTAESDKQAFLKNTKFPAPAKDDIWPLKLEDLLAVSIDIDSLCRARDIERTKFDAVLLQESEKLKIHPNRDKNALLTYTTLLLTAFPYMERHAIKPFANTEQVIKEPSSRVQIVASTLTLDDERNLSENPTNAVALATASHIAPCLSESPENVIQTLQAAAKLKSDLRTVLGGSLLHSLDENALLLRAGGEVYYAEPDAMDAMQEAFSDMDEALFGTRLNFPLKAKEEIRSRSPSPEPAPGQSPTNGSPDGSPSGGQIIETAKKDPARKSPSPPPQPFALGLLSSAAARCERGELTEDQFFLALRALAPPTAPQQDDQKTVTGARVTRQYSKEGRRGSTSSTAGYDSGPDDKADTDSTVGSPPDDTSMPPTKERLAGARRAPAPGTGPSSKPH